MHYLQKFEPKSFLPIIQQCSLFNLRYLNTKPVAHEAVAPFPFKVGDASQRAPESAFEKIDLTFSDTKNAFASKKTYQLLRSLLVFKSCSVNFLVDHNKTILKWSRKLLGKYAFEWLMKCSFYGHFVAGENKEKIKPIINRMREYGVKSILDYSVEKDVNEEKAIKQETEYKEEIVEDLDERPDNATAKFKTTTKLADRSVNVVSARTYQYESEEQCDKNRDIFLECIDAVSHSTRNEGFAAIKLTALGRPHLLLQMSDFLTQMENCFNLLVNRNTASLPAVMRFIDKESFRENLNRMGIEISYDEQLRWFTLFDVTGDGMIDQLEWSHLKNFERDMTDIFRVRNVQTGKYQHLVPTLTEEGLEEMRAMFQRVDSLVTHAKSRNVRVMVDAEQTYLQPAIRRITMEMMRKFNKDWACIFNTYQCYLKEAINHIDIDLKLAENEDFYFGAKLVRGAYMEQERERARLYCYTDPINPTYKATTEMYERVLTAVFEGIQRRPKGRIAVMVASHNEDTIRFAVRKMNEYGILSTDKLICFGQLLGMCDHISFTLGHAGYSVYKYVPYGPVEEVLPYLSRRAMENKCVMSNTKREQTLLKSEIIRRLKS